VKRYSSSSPLWRDIDTGLSSFTARCTQRAAWPRRRICALRSLDLCRFVMTAKIRFHGNTHHHQRRQQQPRQRRRIMAVKLGRTKWEHLASCGPIRVTRKFRRVEHNDADVVVVVVGGGGRDVAACPSSDATATIAVRSINTMAGRRNLGTW